MSIRRHPATAATPPARPLASGDALVLEGVTRVFGALRAVDNVSLAVVAGQKYWWCACGLSRSQPFCDGSHKGSAFQPLAFVAERSERLWLCGCKRTAGQPRCDGSHRNQGQPR